ncbi:MAG: hypothetical protein U1F45_08750 [Burkholderiales bacterium]
MTYPSLVAAGRKLREVTPKLDEDALSTIALGLVAWNARHFPADVETTPSQTVFEAAEALIANAFGGKSSKLTKLLTLLIALDKAVPQEQDAVISGIRTAFLAARTVLGYPLEAQSLAVPSKLLHWLCPRLFPILDSKVAGIVMPFFLEAQSDERSSSKTRADEKVDLYCWFTASLWSLGLTTRDAPDSSNPLSAYWRFAHHHMTPIRAVEYTLFSI